MNLNGHVGILKVKCVADLLLMRNWNVTNYRLLLFLLFCSVLPLKGMSIGIKYINGKLKMKSYTKKYLDYFGYDEGDFIPCELCGARAVDIHHIHPRSIAMDRLDDISNLAALCRSCHVK